MPTQVQFRRGTTAQNNSFTGAAGELSVDTTLDTIRVHDGSTAGGFEIVQKAATQTLTNKTLTSPSLSSPTLTGTATCAVISVNSGGAATAIVNGSTDGVGNIGASGDAFNTVFAKATSAQYADLAEKYSTGEELVPGTVVCIDADETHDVAPAQRGCIAIGVVSTNPALMMNSEADGQYIGLKGRLPVRVVGAVSKGQTVYVDDNGCASTAINGGSIVGIALESNNNDGEKLVECVLKV